MRGIRSAIAVAAALGAAGAGARPRDMNALSMRSFCAELKRVVEVAELDGDFTYLERSRAAPPRLGFAHGCRATGGTRPAWYCHQSLAPESLGLAALSARTAACLPEAVREPSPWPRHEAAFALPHARIRITEHGGPGAHVGRIVSYSVEADRPAK